MMVKNLLENQDALLLVRNLSLEDKMPRGTLMKRGKKTLFEKSEVII